MRLNNLINQASQFNRGGTNGGDLESLGEISQVLRETVTASLQKPEKPDFAPDDIHALFGNNRGMVV